MNAKTYKALVKRLLDLAQVGTDDRVLLAPASDPAIAEECENCELLIHCTVTGSQMLRHIAEGHDDEEIKPPVTDLLLWHANEMKKVQMIQFDLAIYFPLCVCNLEVDTRFSYPDYAAISAMLDFAPATVFGIIPTDDLENHNRPQDDNAMHILQLIKDSQYEHFGKDEWTLFCLQAEEEMDF